MPASCLYIHVLTVAFRMHHCVYIHSIESLTCNNIPACILVCTYTNKTDMHAHMHIYIHALQGTMQQRSHAKGIIRLACSADEQLLRNLQKAIPLYGMYARARMLLCTVLYAYVCAPCMNVYRVAMSHISQHARVL
jgi:hypothetical protein